MTVFQLGENAIIKKCSQFKMIIVHCITMLAHIGSRHEIPSNLSLLPVGHTSALCLPISCVYIGLWCINCYSDRNRKLLYFFTIGCEVAPDWGRGGRKGWVLSRLWTSSCAVGQHPASSYCYHRYLCSRPSILRILCSQAYYLLFCSFHSGLPKSYQRPSIVLASCTNKTGLKALTSRLTRVLLERLTTV